MNERRLGVMLAYAIGFFTGLIFHAMMVGT